MRELIPGHRYELDNLQTEGKTRLQFRMDPEFHEGMELWGPSTQEVIRVCIARVKHLNHERRWWGNRIILYHLRMAIIWFEIRALIRRVQKGQAVENLDTFDNGHLVP